MIRCFFTKITCVVFLVYIFFSWSCFAQGKLNKSSYDLSRMEVTSWILLQLKQYYLDPTRISPPKMLRHALQYIERRIPEVEIKIEGDQVNVQVEAERASFNVGEPETVWEMNYNLQPVFRFIGKHLDPSSDPKDVEFAAVNGMLSSLDPHSVLLPPEIFREMKLKTSGEFGGIGIRISIRNNALTVISPLPGTPAAQMGLEPGDQIVRIEDRSTVNMSLDEAVNFLRGKKGTKVTVWIQRQGWSEARKYVITRSIIRVQTINSKLLDGKIGYIQISDFSLHTGEDLRTHLSNLHDEENHLCGLILDLRNNAGGLMKSAVEAADLFLQQGTIVSTVTYTQGSSPGERIYKHYNEQHATSQNSEKALPIVVLINSGSASASEILAGALRKLGRAVLIGEQTFGKGTVQVLHERVPLSVDGACLKLTIAEYLLSDRMSIQEIGITPDVRLIPMVFDEEELRVFASQKRFRETLMPDHLKKRNNKETLPYAREIRYIADKSKPEQETFDKQVDFPIRFARDFLLHVKNPNTAAMLDEGAEFLHETWKREFTNMTHTMKQFNVDWSSGNSKEAQGKTIFTLEGQGVNASGCVRAAQKVRMKLQITNISKVPFFRLRAESRSTNLLYDHREFLFGRIDPGESKSSEMPITIPRSALNRTDDVCFVFFCEQGSPPPALKTTISIKGLPRPAFGFSWRVVDNTGNADGLIQSGENIRLEVTVVNMGEGKAYNTKALLRNEAGKDLFLEAGGGKVDFGEIPVNGRQTRAFCFHVRNNTQLHELPVELLIWDEELDVSQIAKIHLPIHTKQIKPTLIHTGIKIRTDHTPVRGGANEKAPIVAFANLGSVLLADRQCGNWYRIQGPNAHTQGWIHAQKVKEVKTSRARVVGNGSLTSFTQYTPPKIQFEQIPAYVKDQDKICIKGQVIDKDQDLRDVCVWIGMDKIALVSGKGAQDPRNLRVNINVELKPGTNILTIVAREGIYYASQKSFVLTRPGGLDDTI